MNLNNFGNEQPADGRGVGWPLGSFPLARQTSIYSLTFDEFQSTMGGNGKDFGSMNLDELLKNIWNAEETQTVGSNNGGGQEVGAPGGYLQRQGSLTLPRTLSQKTVDEVWRDLSKESSGAKEGSAVGRSNLPQRQLTLGEMTLEEFLVRAVAVREDTQLDEKPNNTGYFGDFSFSNHSTALDIGFPLASRNMGLMGNIIPENGNQTANLPLNANGFRSTQQQLPMSQPQQQQQQLFPKQATLAYANPMPIPNSAQLTSPGMRGGIVGMADPSMTNNLVQSAALQGERTGMVAAGATVATGSPSVSSDGLRKSNGETTSVSPVPYVFNGNLRGRRCSGAVEKVVERRQRRMIKNRESAAKSRARKQAYTTELETEVAKLKEENQELQKKQEEIMEMQKSQVLQMLNMQRGVKRQCLRRTQTGQW
uniref:RD29B protein n=1 Tax=Camptotheca acuminata TaxID=16922 RepID=A0A7G4WFF4_CAMAC|nr:RD29B protein [Camptotheca acuminata]